MSSETLGPPRLLYVHQVLIAAWDPAAVPDGYTVEVSVTDGEGQPLSPPPDILVADDSAKISGPAIAPGAVLIVSLRAVSPTSASGAVTLLQLAAPTGLRLSWAFDGVFARWDAVDGAEGYRVVVALDGLPPSLPQPEVRYAPQGDPATAWIDGADFTDGQLVTVAVHAAAQGVLGPRSDLVSITIDTSLPENPLLQALLLRLQAAMPDVVLDADTIQSVNITYLFEPLLGAESIPLDDAELSSDTQSVTLRGTATLFGEVRPVVAVFTAVETQLQLQLSFDFGPTTVRQLKEMGLVPPDLYEAAAWADDLAQFQALNALFDSAQQSLRLTGPEADAPWTVFGIPSVTLSTPTPDILVRAPSPLPPKLYAPRVKTTFVSESLASPLPIYLQVPAGASPWEAGLDTGDGLYIGNLTDLYVLFGGDSLDLPQGLVDLGQVTLNTLSVAYDPLETGVWTWAIAFRLGATPDGTTEAPTWAVIPGVLEISGLSVALTVRVAPDASAYQAMPFGDIRGYFKLGNLPVVLQINVPDIADWWVLKGATDGPIELSDMAQLLGGNTTALSDTLAPMGTVDGFTLTKLVLVFRPVNPTIKLAQFGMALKSWTVESLPWFVVDQLALGFKIDNPLDDATRRIQAEIRGQMTLSETVSFGIIAKVDSGSSLWSLRMGAWPALLSGVDALSDILSPAEINEGVPPGMPLDGPVELDVFGFVYNSADAYFPSIDLTMRNSLNWTIVPDLFVLNSIDIALVVTQASASDEAIVTGRVAGRLNLVGAFLELAASKPTAGDSWTFTGRLLAAYTIDFQALLQSLISPDIVLPSGYGFPTSLTLITAQAELVPDTGAFSLIGFAYTEWSIAFGSASFSVAMLGGELRVAGTGSDELSRGKVVGWFTGLGLAARASVETGEEGIDTVVAVEISDAVLDAALAVNSISGADTWDAALRPPDFPAPQTFRAGVNLNLTQNRFLAYGEYFPEGLSPEGMYLGVALYVAPDPKAAAEGQDPPWGWVLGASLHDWDWGQISAGLAPLQGVVLVKDAGVALSLFAEELPDKTLPITIPGLSERSIPPGLSFYAALGFPTEGLFAGVWELLGFGADTHFAFGGLIPPDSALSSFWAELGDFSLLNLVPFNTIRLEYKGVRDPETQVASWVLTLHGEVIVTVDDVPYTYTGDVRIDDAQAAAQIVGPAIPEPLGIPTLTLGPSLFDFRHSYTDDTTALGLAGQMEFANAKVAAFLFFQLDQTAVPVVIDVQIANLNLDDLMSQFIGEWPEGLLNVTFITGELYLATQDFTLPSTELPPGMLQPPASFKEGFFARTVVDVYMMTRLELGFSLTQEGDEVTLIRGYARSVEAVDWGFVSFYTMENEVRGGPEIFIRGTRGDTDEPYVFGARCTIDLFESEVSGVEVLVGSDFMSGTLTIAQDVALFGGRSLTFRWDDDGFTVNGWELPDFLLPDMDGFANVDIEGDCPTDALIQFLPTTDTVWDLDVSFKIYPGTDAQSATLGIRIKGTFNLVINSNLYQGDDTLLTVDIVDCESKFPIPFTEGFTWDSFADEMVQLLKDAAVSIFSNLVLDPQNLAKLLAVSGISWAQDKLLEFLTCEGTHEAEDEGMSEEEAEEFGEEFAEAFTEGTMAVGGATVAVVGGAVVLGEVGMDVAGATLVVVLGGAAFGAVAGVVTIATLSSNSKAPGTPGAPTLSYAGKTLTASWGSVSDATDYQAQVTGDAKRSSSMSHDRSASFNLDPGTYKVGVVASGPGGTSPMGPKSTATMLGAPKHLALSFDEPILSASWDAVSGADSYPVAVRLDGQLLSPQPALTWTSATSFTSADPRFVGGAKVEVEVSATNGWGTGPSADQTLTLTALAPPAGLTLLDVPGAIAASWQAVDGAQSYQLRVRDSANNLLNPQPSTSVSGTSGTIAGDTLSPGASYGVEVAAQAPDAVSAWSAPTTIVWIQLGLPTLEPPIYDSVNATLRVGYRLPEGADSLSLQLLNASNEALNPQPPVLSSGPLAVLLDAAGLQVNGSYGLQGRAEAPQAQGPWSAAWPLTLVPLTAPAAVSATNTSAGVQVSWSPVAGAEQYRVLTLSGPDAALNPQPAPELLSETELTLPAASFVDGQSYAVRVLAYAAGVYGPASPAVPFTRWSLPAPGAPTLVYYPNNQGLQATWLAVEGAQTYTVTVLDAEGLALNPQPEALINQLTASIDASGLPAGSVIQVVVQAHAGALLSPPSAPGAGTLAPIGAPAELVVAIAGPDLAVSWTPDPAADGHIVELLDSRNQAINPQPPMTVSGSGATISGASLQDNTLYGVRVRATLGISLSPWTGPAQIRWVELAAPTQLTALNQPERVQLTWLTVAGASDYALEVSDTADKPLSPQPESKLSHKGKGWVDARSFTDGLVYRFRLQALAQGVASAWSSPLDLTRASLAAPTDVTVSWRQSNALLLVSWSAVAGASTYSLEVLDRKDRAVLEQSGITTNSAMVSSSTLTVGASYTLRVRGVTPSTSGPWSELTAFTLGTAPTSPEVSQVTVNAKPVLNETGVVVASGDLVTVRYLSGSWTANPKTGMVNAAGNARYVAKPGYLLPGAKEGCLVGQVGTHPTFYLGATGTVPAGQTGPLRLGINDDTRKEYGDGNSDNLGAIVVEITRTPGGQS